MANWGTVGIIFQTRNLGAAITAMTNIRRQLHFLQSANRNLTSSLLGTNKAFGSTAASVPALYKTVTQLNNSVAQSTRIWRDADGVYHGTRQTIENLTRTQQTAIGTTTTATKTIRDLNGQLVSTETTVTSLTNSMKGQISAMGAMSASAAIVFGTARKFSTAMVELGQRIRNFGSAIKGLGNELAAVGFRMSFLVTIPIIATLGLATKAAIDFQDSLVKIINLTDANIVQVSQWKDELLELAIPLGRTPQELAEGLYAVTSAGITGTEAIDILTLAAQASSIGLGDLEIVARGLTGIIHSYEEQNLSAARATDILVATVDQGNLAATELAPTIGRVTGLAAEMGLTFEETGAFIASFTRSGVPAEVAVTSLRSALASLLDPTGAATEKLSEYNISVDEVHDAIADPNIGLARTILALTAVFGDDDRAMAEVIGTARGLAGVLFNTRAEGENYLQVLDTIQKSSGKTAEAFDLVRKTSKFQLDQLKAAASVLGITVGDVLLPHLNSLVQAMIPIIKAFTEFAKLNPELTKVAVAIGLIVAATGPLLIIAGLLISSIGTIISAVGGFIAILFSLTMPLNFVIAAIGTLIFFLAAANFNQFIRGLLATSEATIDLSHGLQEGLAAVEDTKKDAATAMADFANRAFEWGANIVIQLANGIATAATYILNALINIGNMIAHWLGPGSAPLLLPDLEYWGENIVLTLIEGMNEADTRPAFLVLADTLGAQFHEIISGFSLGQFNLFEDIVSTVSNVVQSIPGLDELFGSEFLVNLRVYVADAVAEFEELGYITEETLSQITGNFGLISDDLEQYILDLIAVQEATDDLTAAQEALTAAQEALAEVTESYSAQLEPLQDQLDAIDEAVEDFTDQQRIEYLQSVLEDINAPPEAIYFAQLELDQIALEEQVEALEAEQEAAEEAAQAQVDAAEEAVNAAQTNLELLQEQLDITEALIAAQIGYNNAVGNVLSVIEGLMTPIEKLGEELGEELGGGLSAGFGAAATGPQGPAKTLQQSIEEAINRIFGPDSTIITRLTELKDQIAGIFAPITEEGGLLDQLETAWGPIFDTLGGLDWAAIGKGILIVAAGLLVINTVGAVGGKLLTIASGISAIGVALGISFPIATMVLLSILFIPFSIALALLRDEIEEWSNDDVINGLDFLRSMSILFDEMYTVFTNLVGPMGSIAAGLKPLGLAIELVLKGMGVEAATLGIDNLEDFTDTMDKLSTVVGKFTGYTLSGPFAPILGLIDILNGPDADPAIENADELSDKIVRLSDELNSEPLGVGQQSLISWLTSANPDGIPGAMLAAYQATQEFVDKSTAAFNDWFDIIIGHSILPEFADRSIDIIQEWAATLVGMDGIIPTFLGIIVTLFSKWVNDLIGEGGIITTWVTDTVAVFLQAGSDFITLGLIPGLESVASTISTTISTIVGDAVTAVWNALPQWFRDLLNGILPEHPTGNQSETTTTTGQPAASGMFGLVPPGYPNDTFGINATSGELVSILTASQVNSMRQAFPPALSMPAGLAGLSQNVTIGPNNVSSNIDMALLTWMVSRAVSSGVGGL